MTGGIGFTKLGQALQRNNRSLLKHTNIVKSKKDGLEYPGNVDKLKFKKPTKKELDAFKAKLYSDKRKQFIKTIILFIATLLSISLLSWIIFW